MWHPVSPALGIKGPKPDAQRKSCPTQITSIEPVVKTELGLLHDLASYGQRKNTWGIADLSRHQNLHNLSNRLALHQEPLCQLQQLLHSLSCQGVEPLSNGMLVVLSKVKPLR
jgi:hypothetical protein